MIKFRFNARKAVAHIADRIRVEHVLDVSELHACLYLADKAHFVDWGRTVFGGDYDAEAIGPVHRQVREMLLGDPTHLCDTPLHAYPWRLEGRFLLPCASAFSHPRLPAPETLNVCEEMSGSDTEALKAARRAVNAVTDKKDFRRRVLHDAAWSKARGGLIRFEDVAEDAGLPEHLVNDREYWHVSI